MQRPDKKRGVGIDELCGSRIPPLPEDDAKFFEFPKIDEDGPSRAGRPSKNVYHAAIQNLGFALLWDSEWSRVGWLNVGCS